MGLVVEVPEESKSVPPVGVSANEETAPAATESFEFPGTFDPLVSSEQNHNLRLSDWLYRSRQASVIWLVVRLWLGYQWLNAGYQKIWGAERAAFGVGGGAGVKGFASAGVAGSATGKGGASYGWWAAFLHNFVIPNASWIAKLVSLGELLIGVALILGLLTGFAAAAGLLLNLTYMFSGSAGVNPMYGVLALLLILAWHNSGWIGLDRFVLHHKSTGHRLGSSLRSGTHEQIPSTS
jgi:thiosulfate dehydrogenase [quinone] large subunit